MTCQVLDITRTMSRVGRGLPTGIDRVERAYIIEFLRRFSDPIFLAKLTHDFIAIDAGVMRRIVDAEFGEALDNRVGISDRFRFKLPQEQRRVRSFARAQAKVRFGRAEASTTLQRYLPEGFHYTNVGHSNLDDGFLSQLKPAGCSKIRIMIHDMIPLDFPQYCRDKTPEEFRNKMQAFASVADVIVCNSEYTKSRVQKYFANWPNNATYIVAYLGAEERFKKIDLPKSIPNSFVVLGTIEPRKNHALLLDVWTELAKNLEPEEMPILYIVGKRGWENDAFFDRLQGSPLFKSKIIEHNSLGDDDLTDLLNTASAMLFPSHVEGYGLPAIEAAAAGLPVILSDIPVFKELFNNQACFLPSNNIGAWVSIVLEILNRDPKCDKESKKYVQNMKIPCWSAHFGHIFKG